MARHGALRARPGRAGAGHAARDHLPHGLPAAAGAARPARIRCLACIARYARGRDYHKVLRSRLQKLCDRIEAEAGAFGYRVFADSAPVMEVELAAQGRHRLARQAHAAACRARRAPGSSSARSIPACRCPPMRPRSEHCGTCTTLHRRLPDAGDPRPYQLDARRCISYLTIELKGSIPEALRPLIGNRVYGCDDCQAVCPWNTFARPSAEPDFAVRNGLDRASLVELFALDRSTSSTRAWRARRSGASATSAGCATSRSAWATRLPRPRCCARCAHAPTILRRWCASTSPGRSPGRARLDRTHAARHHRYRRKTLEEGTMAMHAFVLGAAFAALASGASAQSIKLPATLTVTAYDTGSSGFNIAVAVGKAMKDKHGTDTRVLPAGNDVARLAPAEGRPRAGLLHGHRRVLRAGGRVRVRGQGLGPAAAAADPRLERLQRDLAWRRQGHRREADQGPQGQAHRHGGRLAGAQPERVRGARFRRPGAAAT